MFNTSRALFNVEPGTLMRTHFIVTFEKISDTHKKMLLFWLFLSKFCHADLDSREQQAILLKKVENVRPKLRIFFLFFRQKNWHDFVTPFSTFANIKGSLPTNSTTLDRLRSWIRTDDEDFPAGFWPIIFSNIAKKSVLSDPRSSDDLHPKRSPY